MPQHEHHYQEYYACAYTYACACAYACVCACVNAHDSCCFTLVIKLLATVAFFARTVTRNIPLF